MSLEISKAEALAIAAAYVPSVSLQKTVNDEYLDIDHDIDMCAQNIESLEWEVLGITGARGASDDMAEDEIEMEVQGKKDNKEIIQFREGSDVIRSGVPAICFFMGIF